MRRQDGVMEDAMPTIRIVTTGTLAVVVFGAAIASVAAQSATQSVGSPLANLRIKGRQQLIDPVWLYSAL